MKTHELVINKCGPLLAKQFGIENPVYIQFQIEKIKYEFDNYMATEVFVVNVAHYDPKTDDYISSEMYEFPRHIQELLEQTCLDHVNNDARELITAVVERQRDIDAETRMEQMHEERRSEEY